MSFNHKVALSFTLRTRRTAKGWSKFNHKEQKKTKGQPKAVKISRRVAEAQSLREVFFKILNRLNFSA